MATDKLEGKKTDLRRVVRMILQEYSKFLHGREAEVLNNFMRGRRNLEGKKKKLSEDYCLRILRICNLVNERVTKSLQNKTR